MSDTRKYVIAAIAPDAGMVITQAITIELATFHLTADARRAAPTPIIAPVMVWVVETGTPSHVAMNSVAARPSPHKIPALASAGDPQAHGAHDAPTTQ